MSVKNVQLLKIQCTHLFWHLKKTYFLFFYFVLSVWKKFSPNYQVLRVKTWTANPALKLKIESLDNWQVISSIRVALIKLYDFRFWAKRTPASPEVAVITRKLFMFLKSPLHFIHVTTLQHLWGVTAEFTRDVMELLFCVNSPYTLQNVIYLFSWWKSSDGIDSTDKK